MVGPSYMADIYDKVGERSKSRLCAHDVDPNKCGSTRG